MPDQLGNRRQEGGSHILISDPSDVRQWCRHLKVSPDELQCAIDKVGNSVSAVRKELGNHAKENKAMDPTSSRDMPGAAPQKDDKERETREAIIKDAAENDGKDRDLVHGEGDTIDIPVQSSDLTKND